MAGEPALQAQQAPTLRKIGELDLAIRGLSATTEATQTLPKTIASGVRVTIRAGTQELTVAEAVRFLGGPFAIAGELSGPGVPETQALRSETSGSSPSVDPFLLRIPGLPIAGDYTLSNLRVVREVRNAQNEASYVTALDVNPRTVTLDVLDQILITSVTTRPLTLEEIKARGIVLDADDYKGFQFTIGMKLESKPVTISFPAIFDRQNIAVPQPLTPPTVSRADVPVPQFVPVLLQAAPVAGGDGKRPPLSFDGGPEITIPSVLVIPGNVGYLDQFFSAQLFVANGAPIGTPLSVHAITGKVRLPEPADGNPDHAPLKLAETETGVHETLPVRGLGLDGQPGTGDDVDVLNPGEQGQAEFLIQAKDEGYYKVDFDIKARLEGLPVGPVEISGTATGGVLVRNPYYDMTFTMPSVVRADEPFKMFATITNIGQGIGNAITIAIDAAALVNARVEGDASQFVATLMPGDAATVEFTLVPEVTGQAVATYLRFDGEGAGGGRIRFKIGVGERGVPLSPDTLVLPSVTDALPQGVVRTAMRVLGQAYSAANAPAGTLPAGVARPGKDVVTQKALALAEAGLRITLDQPLDDALRDLAADFYLGLPAGSSSDSGSGVLPTARFDAGWDQILRQTDAGHALARALGAALVPATNAAAGALGFERAVAQVQASGADFISIGVDAPTADIALTNASGAISAAGRTEARPSSAVPGATFVPLGGSVGVPDAPVLGLITSLTGSPYTLSLTGRTSGAAAVSVTLPRGDGTFVRGAATGVAVSPTWRGRVVVDLTQPTHLTLEQDAEGDGTFESQIALATETVYAQGAKLQSANVIGPEVIDGAAPFGQHAVLVFDRMVDAASAADKSRYQIPSNAVIGARAVMSRRIVMMSLEQPEGPWVPTTVTATGILDGRGVARSSTPVDLGSRLRDPGALVTGRVFHADGTPVAGGEVLYEQNPAFKSCDADEVKPLSRIVLDAAGAYQLRYVRRDNCGYPFTIKTKDPSSGAVVSVSRSVRSTQLLAVPERIVADIALFGRGAVTGVVRDLQGQPVGGATVAVASVTDNQVGGTAVTDGDGRYTVAGITVGVITVRAVKGTSQGYTAGRIDRAGGTAQVDVTLDGGTVTINGHVTTLTGSTRTKAPGVVVAYYVQDRPVGFTTTDSEGHYEIGGMPTGAYQLRAKLDAYVHTTIDGTAGANETIVRDIVLELPETATITGTVQLPNGQGAAQTYVSTPDRAVTTGPNGEYTILNVPLARNIRVTATTFDGKRSASTNVDLTQANSTVTASLVLSGLGRATFTVVDTAGNALSGVLVTRLDCSNTCGCEGRNTNDSGEVTFENVNMGRLRARAFKVGTATDTADGEVFLAHDGDTARGTIVLNGFGTVTGLVLDDQNQAVFGADVEVTSNRYQNDGFICKVVPGVSHRVRTGQNGRFSIPAVNVGPVTVRVSQAFLPTVVTSETKTIASAGGNVDFTVRLVNTMSGVLSGTVRLPNGSAAGAGVEVTVAGVLPPATVRTNDAGEYRYAKFLPEGRYTLTAADPLTGGKFQKEIFLTREVDAQHELPLKGRGAVTVHVVDAAGQPVSEAYVRLSETSYPSNTYQRSILPGSSGVAVFQRVFEGPISIEVSDAFSRGGRVSSAVPADGANVAVTVRLSMTGNITGHVRMPDRISPIPNAVVNLISGARVIGQTSTQGDDEANPGSFSFDYVPGGSFRLEMLDPDSARTGVATGKIEAQNQTVDVDLIAQALGTVEGAVTGDEGPQRGALVTLQSGTFKVDTITDFNGLYRVTGVPAGVVSVTAALDTAGFLRGTASATLVGEDDTLTLNVQLHKSGSVSGQLEKAIGEGPPPAAMITIVGTGTGGGRQQTVTQPDGTFTFTRVPSGPATITADVLNGVDQARTLITVPENATVPVTVKLNGVGSARVTALDSDNSSVAGVITVSSVPSAAFPYTRSVTTDASGIALVPDLLAGDVTVRLRVADGVIARYGTATATIQPDGEASITVRLQDSGTITGHVLRSNGAAAVGADVQVVLSNGRGQFTINTDDAGRFEASGVPIGAFELHIFDKASNGSAFEPSRNLAANGETVDVGTITLDDSAVQVLAVEPVPGAENVLVTQPVVLTFSDPLKDADGISVRSNGTLMSDSVQLSGDRKTATITPYRRNQGRADWPDNSDLDIVVTTELEDVFGRHPAQALSSRFTTQDITPPSVAGITPVDGDYIVDPATAITVTFNEPLDADRLTDVVIVEAVSGVGTGRVAGSPAVVANVLTFTPSAQLAGSTRYRITIDNPVDVHGNQQTQAVITTFSTTDTVAPTLTLDTPENGGKTNQAQPPIRIEFADAASGLAVPAPLHVTLDGTDYTPSLTVGPSFASFRPAALPEGLHNLTATIQDRAGNTGTLAASFTVEFEPVGSITGHLQLPDGSPAAGHAVKVQGANVPEQITDPSGAFRFDDLPLQVGYHLTAKNAGGRLRGRSSGYIVLVNRGQVVDVTFKLQGEGTVTGRVLDPDGLPLPDVNVEIQSQNPFIGPTAYNATTDATGEYRLDIVPEGSVSVSAYVAAGPWRGNASGTVVRDQSLTLDIQLLEPTQINFPVSRRDGNNYSFSISRTGASGNNDWLLDIVPDGGVATRFEGSAEPELANDGREVVLRQLNIAGLNVTRKIFVPADGYFARYIERLTNPGAAPVTVTLKVTSTISAPGGYHPDIKLTSSGDQELDVSTPATADRWLTIDDQVDGETTYSTMQAFGFLLDGEGGARRIGTATLGAGSQSRTLVYEWRQVTIEPGQTISFLHFGVQQPNKAGAEASMRRLERLPPEALAGLEAVDIETVRNFAMPPGGVSLEAPLVSLLNTVTGRVFGGDGETPVANAEVTFRSLHSLFGRIHKVQGDSQGLYTVAGFISQTGGTSRPVPRAPFEVTAKHPNTSWGESTEPGEFEDEETASVDIELRGTGVIRGTVRGFDGLPQPGARVTVYYDTYAYHRVVDADSQGVFTVTGVWPTEFRLTAEIDHHQGSDVLAEATVTVIENTRVDVDIVPVVGGVTGRIVDTNGTALVGQQVQLTIAGRSWSATTNTDGYYTFVNVPATTFARVDGGPATEPVRPNLEIRANQVERQDFTFFGTGTINVTVTNANGTAAPSARVYLVDQNGDHDDVGRTDATGKVTATDIRLGVYVVRAYPENYQNQFTVTAPAPVSLDQHGQTVSTTIALPPLGALTGRIRFPNGSNASFASLEVRPASAPDGPRVFGSTDSSGRYTIPKVWANTPLTVKAYLGVSVRTVSASVADGATQTLDITLPARATVRVHVQRADGSPMRGIRVHLEGDNYGPVPSTTNDNGDANFDSVPEGTFVVRTDHGQDHVTVTVTAANHGQTLVFTLTETGMSRLTIRTTAGDGVTPAADSYVRVYDAETEEEITDVYLGTDGATADVPSSRRLRLDASSSWELDRVEASKEVMSPAADQTEAVVVALPLAVITGHVTHSDGTPIASSPVVSLMSGDGYEPRYLMTTPPDGGFKLVTPLAGAFFINARDPETGLTGAATDTIESVSTPLVANVVLQPSGTVTGTVFDMSGVPVANAPVGVISSGADFNRLAQANADGHFTISRVALGELTVQAGSGLQRTSNIGKLTSEGQSITVDLTFGPTGTVQGRVVDQQAAPVADIRVTVQAAGSHGPLGPASFETNTDAAGNYRIDGVPVGGLKVGAGDGDSSSDDGFAVDELTAAGATVSINVALGNAYEPVWRTYLRSDGTNIWFDFQCTGDIRLGGNYNFGEGDTPWFDGAASLRLYGAPFPCASQVPGSVDDRRFAFGPALFGELIATRHTFVPASGQYARYLESITNPTNQPITLDVIVRSRFRPYPSFTVTTTPASTGNRYLVAGSAGFVVAGTGAAAAPTKVKAPTDSPDVVTRWTMTIAPGQTVGLLHFLVQTYDAETTRVMAEALAALNDPDALTGLTPQQRATIVNFLVP